MKLAKLILLVGLVINISYANDTLLKEMKNMRDGMNLINDGFFYNEKDKINSGLDLLKNANKMFKTQADVKKSLPVKKKHMVGLSFKSAQDINKNIAKMEKLIKQNKFSKASGNYANIINSCTSCHKIVRNW